LNKKVKSHVYIQSIPA